MISATDISKRYWIYDRAADRLRDWVTRGRSGREFWALRDVSFEIASGTSMGIVGVNGAGKSTLLKILTGTTVPTTGEVKIEGRVSALLELGMGFHPEFTGRENIFFNGKMLGLHEDELAEKTEEIIEFSEIADFIDQPLRTYSSGMGLRLAFAIASSVDPDVLIVDEAMAVGDLHFQQKCLARIREFHERGVTILFVSHDPSLVKSFCTEAILLDGGNLVDRGKPDHVLDYYNALLAEKHRSTGARARVSRPKGSDTAEASTVLADADTGEDWGEFEPTGHRTGNFDAVITGVRIESTGVGGNNRIVTPGSSATIAIRLIARESINSPTVGILIKDRLGREIFGTNSLQRGVDLGSIPANEGREIRFAIPFNLGEGLYSITAAIHSGHTHTETCFDWIEHAESVQVIPSPAEQFIGVARLDPTITQETITATEAEKQRALSLTESS